MNDLEKLAWQIYCAETAGCMSARDYWHELSDDQQKAYMRKAVIRKNSAALQYLSRKIDQDYWT